MRLVQFLDSGDRRRAAAPEDGGDGPCFPDGVKSAYKLTRDETSGKTAYDALGAADLNFAGDFCVGSGDVSGIETAGFGCPSAPPGEPGPAAVRRL